MGGRKERLRSALVIAEVSLSVALLITSGLLIRALWRLHAIDPGFQQAGVLTLRTALPTPKYEKVAQREAFYERVLSGVRALPGVQSAGFCQFSADRDARGGLGGGYRGPSAALREPHRQHAVYHTRFFGDGHSAEAGTRVERPTARRRCRWPWSASRSCSATGRDRMRSDGVFRSPRNSHDCGVAGNVRVRGLEAPSEPQVYLSSRQMRDGNVVWYAPKDLAVRTTVNPTSLTAAIRAIIHDADPQQPISDVQTLTEIVESNTASRRVQARVLGAFASVAFLLAAVGIHGLLSFSVSQRTQEIGVRMALGAKSGQILSLILGESSRLAIAGVVLGRRAWLWGGACDAVATGGTESGRCGDIRNGDGAGCDIDAGGQLDSDGSSGASRSGGCGPSGVTVSGVRIAHTAVRYRIRSPVTKPLAEVWHATYAGGQP